MWTTEKRAGATIAAILLLLALIAALGRGVAYAADGDLDYSFDGDGKVTTDFLIGGVGGRVNDANAVAVQADGKIVVAGTVNVSGTDNDFGLARYNTDGSLDTSFGVAGFSTAGLSFDTSDDEAYALAIQPDGKIVVVGMVATATGTWHGYAFAAARFYSTGFLDTSFGDTQYHPGRTWWFFSSDYREVSVARGVALQDDGKIVVAGYYAPAGGDTQFALARLTADGQLDTSFSGDGKLTTDFFGGTDEARGVALQPDGKIVAAGNAQVSGSNYDFALARYNSDGTLDNGFDGDGKVTTDFLGGGDDGAYALTLQPDGKIVAAGGVHTASTGYDFGVARYLSDGALDTDFSGGGITAINFVGGTAEEVAFGVGLQSDGKIVAAGYAPATTFNDFAVTRLNTDGTLDGTFGSGGKVTTDFVGAADVAHGVAIQADDKIVAAGGAYVGEPNSYDFALARYLTGGASNPTPTATATTAPTACPIQFSDVPQGSTFYDFVRCLACRNILGGYSDGTFRPGNNVTRGQLSKIVSNAAGFNEPVSGQTFEDVLPGSTFYDFIERLSSRGVISGYACGGVGEPCNPPLNRPYFRVGSSATRGQLSKIVCRSRGCTGTPTGQTFEDVPPTHTFYTETEQLVALGAINGYPCGNPEPCVPPTNRPYFRPGNNVTRGQTAKIVSNTFFPNCSTPFR